MNLLDLIFKTEKPEKETLTDDLIYHEKPKRKAQAKQVESEKISNLNYNNINVYSPKNQQEVEKIVQRGPTCPSFSLCKGNVLSSIAPHQKQEINIGIIHSLL